MAEPTPRLGAKLFKCVERMKKNLELDLKNFLFRGGVSSDSTDQDR